MWKRSTEVGGGEKAAKCQDWVLERCESEVGSRVGVGVYAFTCANRRVREQLKVAAA